MTKFILAVLLAVVCPPLGIMLFILFMHSNHKPASFPSGRLESKQKERRPTVNVLGKEVPAFITYKETQKKAVKSMMKPGYNPWSAENRERTLELHKIMDRNRRIADEEMKEEIRREQEETTRKNVETIVSEHRAKQAKERSIEVK